MNKFIHEKKPADNCPMKKQVTMNRESGEGR
jgi:hypothetical protein